MSIKEHIIQAGYSEGTADSYERTFGDTWDENYIIVPKGEAVVDLEYFSSDDTWKTCYPPKHIHKAAAAIHRQLKPGLEKIKVKG